MELPAGAPPGAEGHEIPAEEQVVRPAGAAGDSPTTSVANPWWTLSTCSSWTTRRRPASASARPDPADTAEHPHASPTRRRDTSQEEAQAYPWFIGSER